jgi:hypothetical protein
MRDLLEEAVDAEALDDGEVELLRRDPGVVAQKCTGRAKRPVHLMPRKVVKGPWRLVEDRAPLLREVGRAALMRQWATPDGAAVLEPALWPDDASPGHVYVVTRALYTPEALEGADVSAPVSSASGFGPRQLEVVDRASLGVERVSDLARRDPEVLVRHPEVFEHLIHRFLLGAGDSGLHNMLLVDGVVVGVDLDERRGSWPARGPWMELLFKATPARALHPYLARALDEGWRVIDACVTHLIDAVDARETQEVIDAAGLELVEDAAEALEALRGELEGARADGR